MIRLDVEQGSYEWLLIRLGLVTASNFHRVMPPLKRKPTERTTLKIQTYRNEVLAEWLFGVPLDSGKSQFMERGSDMENEAVRRFEFDMNCSVDRVGFCLRDDKRVGCSPDGFVGDDEGLEIKCPGATNHIGALLDAEDDKHICQIQGNLYVTGRQRWTRMYYHPTLPPVYVVLERDETFISALHEAIETFLESLDIAKQCLLERGCKPREPREPDAMCRARRPDGRWCMSRAGLIETEDGWRCAEHMMPLEEIAVA